MSAAAKGLGLLVALASLGAVAAPTGQLFWPVPNTNVRVCAYRDHAGEDWRCGTNRYSGHKGTDIAVGVGTDVLAALQGTVAARNDGCPYGSLGSTCGSGAGNYVIVSHGGDNTYYFHLSAGSSIAAQGARVACGDRLGGSGSSGNSSGPHLHFEVRLGSGTSAWGGTSDEPFAGACGNSASFWNQQGSGYSSSCSVASTSPKSASTCGCPAGTYNLFNCNADRTARVRCQNGQVETEACEYGCEVQPLGVNDTCKAPPPCPEGLDATWRCTADGASRQRCELGKVTTDVCSHGCEGGAGQPGVCRVPPLCPSSVGSAWQCSADGTARERCEGGLVAREVCAAGCEGGDGVAAECLATSEPQPDGCPEGTYETWTCSLDGRRLERCGGGVLERKLCAAGCFTAAPGGEDSCEAPAPSPAQTLGLAPSLEGVVGGCASAPGLSVLGLVVLGLRRRRKQVGVVSAVGPACVRA